MAKLLSLPKPRLESSASLEEMIYRRRSVRNYAPKEVNLEEIGQLLWAVQGRADTPAYRTTVPSAGALYPLEVYAVLIDGVYHYEPSEHALRSLQDVDQRMELCRAAYNQNFIRQAPLTIVLTAVFARIEGKYGRARGPRYVYIEAGHAAQNLLLQAVALGLGSVPVGAFDDQKVKSILRLPPNHEPLYLLPVGRPR